MLCSRGKKSTTCSSAILFIKIAWSLTIASTDSSFLSKIHSPLSCTSISRAASSFSLFLLPSPSFLQPAHPSIHPTNLPSSLASRSQSNKLAIPISESISPTSRSQLSLSTEKDKGADRRGKLQFYNFGVFAFLPFPHAVCVCS